MHSFKNCNFVFIYFFFEGIEKNLIKMIFFFYSVILGKEIEIWLCFRYACSFNIAEEYRIKTEEDRSIVKKALDRH